MIVKSIPSVWWRSGDVVLKPVLKFLRRPGSAKAALAGFALSALLGAAACDSRTTGVWQLPAPPNRDVTSFNQNPPITGPAIGQTNDCKRADAGYRLGAGDKIRVVVLQDTEFSGDYEVNASGGISVRMLGPVQVVGKTVAEVEEYLRDRYREQGYLVTPRLSVELVSMRPFYIVGEVARSGQFPYVNCLRVIQAIAIAGGFTRRAGKTRLTIKRFYATSAEEEYVTEDTLVEPGDVIRVPERWF
jgi:polysaccharide export outer membrane protein